MALISAALGKQMHPAKTALLVSVLLCLRSYGAPPEKGSDAEVLQQGYGVTVRSYPVSRDAAAVPTPRAQRIPDYPVEMRRRGVSGIVVLRVAVGADGVPRLKEVQWASLPEFEKAAREAVASWAFLPAESDGRAVEAEVDYKFEFKIYTGG